MELIVPNWKACGDFGGDIGISTAPLGIVSHFILTSLVVLMLTAAQPSDEGLATQHEGINITSAGAVDREFVLYRGASQSSPGAPPESPKKLPESPQTSPGALQELPQMLQKLPRVSQRPPRGSECPKSSLEPILGGPSALKCDACAQK